MRAKPFVWSAVIFALLSAPTSFAVEIQGIDLTETLSVIGVLGAGSRDGVVVVKDLSTDKSYALKIGDMLPVAPTFRIISAAGREVTISDGNESMVLTTLDEPKTQEETTVAEAKTYLPYGGWLSPERQGRPLAPEEVPMPLNSFQRMTDEEIRQRLELYRPDRPYRPSSDDEEFVVRYDNFVDDAEDAAANSEDLTWPEEPTAEPELEGERERTQGYGGLRQRAYERFRKRGERARAPGYERDAYQEVEQDFLDEQAEYEAEEASYEEEPAY